MKRHKNIESLTRSLKQIPSSMGQKATAATSEACRLLRADIVQSISYKGTGRTYEKYRPRRTHTASAPNEPPATDTGELKRGIGFTIKKVGTEGALGKVFSSAQHSQALEFGTKAMLALGGARPFMQPALERNRRKIFAIFRKAGVAGMEER